MLDFTLTPEQLDLQKKARTFAREEVLPVVGYFDHIDEMPYFLLRRAFDRGLMNMGIPKEHGGEGRGLIDHAVAVEEIAAACVGVATSIFDNSLGAEPVILSDNQHLKETYLPEIVNNFKLISFATSEPVMGSDVAGIRCRAEQDGDDWILTGTKYWITNGGYADYFSLFATADPKSRHAGVCAFLVEKDWEGVTTGSPIPKLGLRTSNTAGVELDHVRVPKENVIAEPGAGFILAMQTFSRTRPIIGAFATGAARSAMEFAMDYAKKRHAFGDEIGNFQAIQIKLAEMFQKVETARLLTWKAAWEADQGRDPTIAASISKFYGSEAAFQVVSDALQVLGGYGYTAFYPVEKIYRDIRVLMIYEGTSEIQRILLSRLIKNQHRSIMPALEDLPRLWGNNPEKDAREGLPGKKAYRCRVCGYIHYGSEPPEKCPFCGFPKGAFNQVWPGT
ncbi:MAG: acyl-CoA dehydrogenase family protein [Theionarchaea archaeon]|nr:acyl-CoA dehydrogenase family protein [Theionarchaea archaeon]MBU7040811.1 acyl-CoA dehydrogenase family protein [Theionarchaea archaeon]